MSFNIRKFLTESIRQGLPHVSTMNHEQLRNLTSDGKIHLHNLTEKTDGQTHKFGYDEKGFYTQSSGSGNEKMRTAQDYEDRAKRRAQETGKPLDLSAAHAFGHIHRILHSNSALQDHLKNHYSKTGKEVVVRGETFYRPWAKPGDRTGEVKFVGTSYATHHMGSVGKYVIHSQLPENSEHDIEHFKKNLSTSEMNFDDDKIDHKKTTIDVSSESKELDGINHELLKTRKNKDNVSAKEAEQEKLSGIAKRISDKVDNHIKSLNLQRKWGSGSEGIVVHPSETNSSSPRFKVTSDAFRAYRESDSAKNFKKGKVEMKESIEESIHHATVIPLTGFSPISHMGHAHDLGSAMSELPGEKHVGISAKSDLYSGEERANILKRQWKDKAKDLSTHVTNSGGEVVSNAFHALPKGKRILHLLVGHDRKDFAEKLKSSLESGKIKEMNGEKWDEIHIHHPEDTNRSHGMSGTKMRTSVANGDFETFHKHLGSDFSREEAKQHFDKIKSAIDSGRLEVNRPAAQPKKKKVLKEIYDVLAEGGNVKIGDVAAQNISINSNNRQKVKDDIHGMLSDLHDSFNKEHGEHIFGKDKKALHSGSAYSGSTSALMDSNISHEEFAKHKPSVGDIDVKVPEHLHDKVTQHLTPGKKFGKYTVVGVKKSGSESHALMRHEDGGVHQVDFEKSTYENNEPSEFDKFAHSSSWEDTKAGIKGVHHKMLLNAAGGESYKFSITHGVRSRTDVNASAAKHPSDITKTLFGKHADASNIHSFHGVADLIAKHIPKERHQEIYNKFEDSVKSKKGMNSTKALDTLKSKLSLNHSEAKLTDKGLDTEDCSAVKKDKPAIISFKELAKIIGEKMPKVFENTELMESKKCSECDKEPCECELDDTEIDKIVDSATDDDFADVYDDSEFGEFENKPLKEAILVLSESLSNITPEILNDIKILALEHKNMEETELQEYYSQLSTFTTEELRSITQHNIPYISSMARLHITSRNMKVECYSLHEVLSREQRIRSAARFALTQTKRDRKRIIALHRYSSPQVLSKRARRMAVKLLKKRLLNGKNINNLSVGEKERVESRIQKMKNTVARIAMKLSSRIRKIERDRLAHPNHTK